MRDPKRIPRFCKVFESYWLTAAPDLRFGQLVSDFYAWLGREGYGSANIFYLEDAEMLELFVKFMSELGQIPSTPKQKRK